MRSICVCGLVLLTSTCVADERADLAGALTFHVSFDRSAEADFAKGDAKLYTAQSMKRAQVRPGLHRDDVVLEPNDGQYGGSLWFRKKSEKLIYYAGGENLPYAKTDFQGTVAFWMRLNPDADLPPGFVDPLQITDKKWNDASFFVDFTKDSPRQFRLGVFSDYNFWNPQDRKWEDIAVNQRPLVTVAKPPFARDRWTHVVITWYSFNTPNADGRAVLYLDAKPQGRLTGERRISWSRDHVVIMLGINYVGRMDDLAVFDRELSPSEVKQLHSLPLGIKSIRQQSLN